MKNVKLIKFKSFEDNRGFLVSLEGNKNIPFDIKRVYYISDTKEEITRGKHAHKNLQQVLICVNGSCKILVDDGKEKETISLNDKNTGLYIGNSIWREMFDFSKDCVLVCIASIYYDEDDYIRDYDKFLNFVSDEKVIDTVPYMAMDRAHEELKFEIKEKLQTIIKNNCFIGGTEVEKFEQEFAKYCEADYAVGCGNGLDALTLIMRALDIGAGDEVLVPANSFIATALAVDMVGAKPVFVDCNLDTYSICLDDIEKYINSKTKAIIPVPLYGISLDVDKITKIAQKHNLLIIEDAAQAHGATFFAKNNNIKNSPWKASSFSFYPTKNLGALGDAGAIVTNDDVLASKVRMLGNYGSKIKYHHVEKGCNSRLDTIQAAILRIKLKYLESWNQRRRQLAQIYFDKLNGAAGIALPNIVNYSAPVWHVFPIRVLDGKRDELKSYLEKNGIGTNIHYPVPIHKQAAYIKGNESISMPNSELASDQLLSLPLDPFHAEEEIDYVVENIKRFFG